MADRWHLLFFFAPALSFVRSRFGSVFFFGFSCSLLLLLLQGKLAGSHVPPHQHLLTRPALRQWWAPYRAYNCLLRRVSGGGGGGGRGCRDEKERGEMHCHLSLSLVCVDVTARVHMGSKPYPSPQ